jgi:hypothetical protein
MCVLNTWFFAERLLRVQKRLLGPAIDGTRRAANALSRVQCDCATRWAVRRDVSHVLRGDQDPARWVSRPFGLWALAAARFGWCAGLCIAGFGRRGDGVVRASASELTPEKFD